MRFRARPTFVEAVQFTEAMARGDEPLPNGVRMSRRGLGPPPERELRYHRHILDLRDRTSEECPEVEIGDWIVTHPTGPRRVFTPPAFEAAYEPAPEDDHG